MGQCGASYAFSAVGALEGANALATGTLTTLSEQNIIDCSSQYISIRKHYSQCFTLHIVPYGNHGCQGGNMYDSFLYIVANEGIDTSASYPFKGKVATCINCYHI